jgi:hypothetical protein
MWDPAAVLVKPISITHQKSVQLGPNNPGDLTSGGLTGGMGSPYSVNFGTYYPSVVPPPDTNAPMAERMAFTHYQLDCIRGESEVVDGLVLVHAGIGKERLEGGAPRMHVLYSPAAACMLLCRVAGVSTLQQRARAARTV